MPIYEKHCDDCGHDYQFVASVSERSTGEGACPHCRSVPAALRSPERGWQRGALALVKRCDRKSPATIYITHPLCG